MEFTTGDIPIDNVFMYGSPYHAMNPIAVNENNDNIMGMSMACLSCEKQLMTERTIIYNGGRDIITMNAV